MGPGADPFFIFIFIFIPNLLSVKAMPYVRHYIHFYPFDTLFLSVIVDLNMLLHFPAGKCQFLG